MKIPPFGKPLHNLLLSGALPDNSIYLYTGNNAWDKGKASSIMRPRRTLILPPGNSPFIYHWPVQGCSVMILETSPSGEGFISEFGLFLYMSGATGVCVINLFDYSTTYLKKDF